MNTLGKILAQDLVCAQEQIKLDELKKQYVEEVRKFQNKDVVEVKERAGKYEILRAKYFNNGIVIYSAHKVNKDGTKKMSIEDKHCQVFSLIESSIVTEKQSKAMKHESEISKLLEDLFRTKWMTDDEYDEVLTLTLKARSISKQDLSDQIDIGIANGHSIGKQFKILKEVWATLGK